MTLVGDEELVEYFQESCTISPLAQRLAEPLAIWQQVAFHEKERRLTPIYNLHGFIFHKELKPLIEGILVFEHLLTVTRAGFLGKFYRDHVSHMVRVLLIASMIHSKITKEMRIHLDRCDFNALLLSCLFHDIAYPVQEAHTIIEGVHAGLKSLYQSIDVTSPSVVSCNSKHAHKVIEQLVAVNSREKLTNLSEDELNGLFQHHFFERLDHGVLDHGVMAAIELGFLRDKHRTFQLMMSPESYERALLAISLHNIPVEVRLDRFPELYILILADELQEWNRPIFKSYDAMTVVMPKIGIEIKEKNKDKTPSLAFYLDYTNKVEGFDPLRQLGSKGKAISRLQADCLNIHLLIDILPHYPYKDNQTIELELRNSKDKSEWYVSRQDSINWIEEKIHISQSGESADLRNAVLLLLGIWSEDEGLLRKLLQMIGSALLSRHLDNNDMFSVYHIILNLKLDDLRKNCRNGLRDLLLQMRHLCQEDYQEARLKTIRRTLPDEGFVLPEVGPASEEQIDEAESKTSGGGDSGRLKPHILNLRGLSSALYEIQHALDSIEQA